MTSRTIRPAPALFALSLAVLLHAAFPGLPVSDHDVASDGLALSPPFEEFRDRMRVTWNGDRGTAVVTYVTGGQLYAHYFDGKNFTPPIALVSAQTGSGASLNGDAVVAFLNTKGHPDPDAAARDGDALVVWVGSDEEADGAAGANDVLFSTYFNEEHHADALQNFGFQLQADRISLADGAGEHVHHIGLVSDGLVGEARWEYDDEYAWGDATTGISVVWEQLVDREPQAGLQGDWTWKIASWDLGAAVPPDVPLPVATEKDGPILAFGASDSGVDSDETEVHGFHSYNNLVFFRVRSRASQGLWGELSQGYGSLVDDVDVTIQYVAVDLANGAAGPANTLHAMFPDSTDRDESHAILDASLQSNDGWTRNASCIYGSDEGLACCVVMHRELTWDATADDFGEIEADGRLRVSQIGESDGILLDGEFLDEEDGDIRDPVLGGVSLRLSRNGDYIWFAWRKPADAGPSGPSPEDGEALWVRQLLTTRLDPGGGVPAVPPLAERLGPPIQVSAPAGPLDSVDYVWQGHLGYVTGIQSDPDVLHLFFDEGGIANDVIRDARLEADVDPTFGIAPGVTVTHVETIDNATLAVNPEVGDHAWRWSSVDAGSDGDVLVFYWKDLDPSPSAVQGRLFAERVGSGAVEISSKFGEFSVPEQMLAVVATPAGSAIGAFDPATGIDDPKRAHPASHVHVVFREERAEGRSLLTRRYEAGPPVSLGEAFVPNAGFAFQPPFPLSSPASDASPEGPEILFGIGGPARAPSMACDGDRVGAWFLQLDHLWYQEFQPGGLEWLVDASGDSKPDPVDEGNPAPVYFCARFSPPLLPRRELNHAMSFWTKDVDGSGVHRAQARVRD